MDKYILPLKDTTNDKGMGFRLDDIRQILGGRKIGLNDLSKGIYNIMESFFSKHSNGVISGCNVMINYNPYSNPSSSTHLTPSIDEKKLELYTQGTDLYGHKKITIDEGYVLINGTICYFGGDILEATDKNSFEKSYYFHKTTLQDIDGDRNLANGDNITGLYQVNKVTLITDLTNKNPNDYIMFLDMKYNKTESGVRYKLCKLMNYVFDYHSINTSSSPSIVNDIIAPKSNKLTLLTPPITISNTTTNGSSIEITNEGGTRTIKCETNEFSINSNILNVTDNLKIETTNDGTYFTSDNGLELLHYLIRMILIYYH